MRRAVLPLTGVPPDDDLLHDEAAVGLVLDPSDYGTLNPVTEVGESRVRARLAHGPGIIPGPSMAGLRRRSPAVAARYPRQGKAKLVSSGIPLLEPDSA
jgi:hypothetical protein